MRELNAGESYQKCNQCPYTSSVSRNLKKHVKIHSGEKSNKCNQCQFSSYRAHDLRTHLKIHSGERPNICKQCQFAFRRTSDLRIHLKIHSAEKSNKCNQCDFACFDFWVNIWKCTVEKIQTNAFTIIAKLSHPASIGWVALSSLVRRSSVRPASVTSPLISTVWCLRPYKPYIFC